LRLTSKKLAGWGMYPAAVCNVLTPESRGQMTLNGSNGGVIAMGLGRSYSDAFINSRGYVLSTQRLNRFLDFSPATGLLRCESGMPLSDIISVFAPRGWFVPVTPGTRLVSVGGMIASDVHGKNHHRESSFSRHVRVLRVLLADGDIIECSRQQNQDLFWATLGGMGLTGVVLEAEFCLRKIPSRYVRSVRVRTKNLENAVELFDSLDPMYEYTVTWLDCASRGENFGRGVFMAGEHQSAENQASLKNPSNRKGMQLGIPSSISFPLVSDTSISAFNIMYYHLGSAKEQSSMVDDYFYPLDIVQNWNRLYGRTGFLQYQFVVPRKDGAEAISSVLAEVVKNGRRSYLSVLKKFGRQEGLLSFPMEGYTLALDFPIKDGLFEFLDTLDRIVIDHGGRVYLAKDCRLKPEAFSAMYPQAEEWLNIKDKYDPGQVLKSNLSRRLGLTPA
jgi:FAD/FMN-containing dehydrogenase